LTLILPRDEWPPSFRAWTRAALHGSGHEEFAREIARPHVARAVAEVDALVGRIFDAHFGDPEKPEVRADYIEAILRFALDTLPRAVERDRRIAPDDPRKPTAGRHTLDGDVMWFAWTLALEAADRVRGCADHSRRALQLAGIAAGCPANFSARGHRRTRSCYRADDDTLALLRRRALAWCDDPAAAAGEIHELFRIREWGEVEAAE
jgi:hypothetical protein